MLMFPLPMQAPGIKSAFYTLEYYSGLLLFTGLEYWTELFSFLELVSVFIIERSINQQVASYRL